MRTSLSSRSASADATIAPHEWPTTAGDCTPSRVNACWISAACASAVHSRSRGRSLYPKPGRSKAMTRWCLREPVDEAARHQVLESNHRAVQQHDRRAEAAVDVMQPDAVDLDEPARWGMVRFGATRAVGDPRGGGGEHRRGDAGDGEALAVARRCA